MDEFGNLDTADSPEFLANPAQNPMAEYLAQLWRKITPTQRTPGGLLAPSPAPAFGQPNDDDLRMPVPTGALPPAYKPVPRQPVGVFAAAAPPPSMGTQPSRDLLIGDDDSSIPRGPTETGMQSGAGVAPPLPKAPEQGMREQFIARMANLAGRTDPALSPEQKGRALMEAGLAIMAASKPGVSGLAAIGQGGMQGTAVAREMERINRERSDKDRTEGRADVRTELELAGKDMDRADRKEDRAEARRIRELDVTERAADRQERRAIDNRRMDLLEEQVRQGKMRIEKGDGVFVSIDTKTGQGSVVTDASGKPISIKPKDESEDLIVKRIKAIAKLTGRDVKDVASSVLGDKSAEAANELDTNKILRRFPAEYLKGGMNPPEELPARLQALTSALNGINSGTGGIREAPPAAIEFLRKNPNQKEAFRQKYGYLPAGF